MKAKQSQLHTPQQKGSPLPFVFAAVALAGLVVVYFVWKRASDDAERREAEAAMRRIDAIGRDIDRIGRESDAQWEQYLHDYGTEEQKREFREEQRHKELMREIRESR